MDANQTSDVLLNLIRKSNLNFKIDESPFTLSITIRKSFIKNKDGTLRRSGLETPTSFLNSNLDQVNTQIVTKNPIEARQDPSPYNSSLSSSLPFLYKTINREQQLNPSKKPPMNLRVKEHTTFNKSPKNYTNLSSSPFQTFSPTTSQLQGKLYNPMQQPSNLHKKFRQPLPLFQPVTPLMSQQQGKMQTLTNQQHIVTPTKIQKPGKLQVTSPLNLNKDLNSILLKTKSSSSPSYFSVSTSPSRCSWPNARSSTSTSWDFPFKFHPAGLNEDSDANLSDEELDPDELLKKLMIRYNIK